jgi:hypothetical protein
MAKIGRLSLSSDSWLEPGNLRLNGLVYDQLKMEDPVRPYPAKGRPRKDIDAMIEWIRLQGNQFQYQPYEQLVALLRKQGRDRDTKTVLVEKAKDRADLTEMVFPEKQWHKFLGFTIGYGYLPWRALLISIGVILLGTLTFWIGHRRKIIRETKIVEYVEDVTAADPNDPNDPNSYRELRVRKDYPNFNPFVYSLDMFVPLVDLRQATYWLPSAVVSGESETTVSSKSVRPPPTEGKKVDMPITASLMRLYMWLHILAGWVLSSLLVVGLSGLVKR